jgi:predicted transcriptional regulator
MTEETRITYNKNAIASRRQKVAEMYLSGSYQSSIADKLGIDQATVSRDLAELRKEWLERSINHVDQKKAIELAKLDRLEVTYWEAWERSKQNARTVIKRHTPDGNSTERKIEQKVGNPTFLEGVLKCIDRRCQLLGLDAPKRTEMTGKDGGPIEVNDVRLKLLADLAGAVAKDAAATTPESDRQILG